MGYSALLAGETGIDEILDLAEDTLARVIPNDPERAGGADYFNLVDRLGATVDNLVDAIPSLQDIGNEFEETSRVAFNFVTSAPEMFQNMQDRIAEFMDQPEMDVDRTVDVGFTPGG